MTAIRDRLLAAYPRARRYAAVVGEWGIEPDDLVQEAMARVLATAWADDIVDLDAYLRRTISNVASNQRRRLGRGRRLVVVASADGAPAQYPSDLADLLSLSPDVRGLLYLTAVDGLSIAAAADIVGCSEVAARARLSRARRRLRLELEREATNG